MQNKNQFLILSYGHVQVDRNRRSLTQLPQENIEHKEKLGITKISWLPTNLISIFHQWPYQELFVLIQSRVFPLG